jgi:hypothetical protein
MTERSTARSEYEVGWADKLDDMASVEESAPQPHPGKSAGEQPSDKSQDLLVAVTRIERVTRGL